MNGLPLVEAFGPTIQGEGPGAGRNAAFLRLGGCNLSCSWCDSAYTWDGQRFDLRQQITMATVDQIMGQLPDAHIVVVTGGEPLLHQVNPLWRDLLTALSARYLELHLETNGTIAPTGLTEIAFAVINVSPKLPHAGPHRGRQNPEMSSAWAGVGQAVLKVVCRNASDVDEAVWLAKRMGFDLARLWVMPEGTTPQVLGTRWPAIAQAAAAAGINATHRLHVLAWNDERGH